MTRTTGSNVQNNFIKGLITEATTLTFPEQACTDVDNCEFSIIGDVTRRAGIDIEAVHQNLTKDLTGSAITNYFWRSVAGQGSINFVVSQIGNTLYFYKVTGAPISANRHSFTVDLTTFAAGGATTVSTLECQYAAGNGFLFVTNQNCDPFYVSYDISGDTFTTTRLTLQIRDFKGLLEANVQVTDRPVSLSDTHRYNLANQGWPSRYLGTSATSVTPGLGSKGPFTTQPTLSIRVGDRIRIYSRATPGKLGSDTSATGNYMVGTVTAYAGTALTLNVTQIGAAGGPFTDWNIVEEPDYIEAWNINQADYPSNADVWWLNLDTANPPVFKPDTKGITNLPGSAAANTGHFVLNPFLEDRATASGITSLTSVSTGSERPTTVAFHAGRAWFAGVNYQGFNARLYFSQIVTATTVGSTQYANCYQFNDPTSQNFPEELPDDGGVVDIIDCGVVYKMIPVQHALVVIAANGVWAITGGQGAGFVANDFSLTRISTVYNTSGSSVVDVEGLPVWWNFEGIWTVTTDPRTNAMRVVSLSFDTINQFFNSILLESITLARGAYDPQLKVIQWVYKSTTSSSFTDKYVFDKALCYNTVTKAFYTWSFDTTNVRINSIINITGLSGAYSQYSVTSSVGVNNVTANTGADNVITFLASSAQISFQFKYQCSFISGGSTQNTFADMESGVYLDWTAFDSIGQTYTSYFVTGFMTRGDAQRKWQTNYILVWSNPAVQSIFNIQGIDDYSRLSTTGQFTDLINTRPKRFKLRGHGLTKQFKISSVGSNPFDLIGWAVFQSGNKWV